MSRLLSPTYLLDLGTTISTSVSYCQSVVVVLTCRKGTIKLPEGKQVLLLAKPRRGKNYETNRKFNYESKVYIIYLTKKNPSSYRE